MPKTEHTSETAVSLLHTEISSGRFEEACRLIPTVTDLNVKNHQGNTPLTLLCSKYSYVRRPQPQPESMAEIDFYREEQAVIDSYEEHPRLAAVSLLLKYGAKTDLQNQKGQTALHCAVDSEYAEIARKLLQHDATIVDIQDDSTYKFTALHCATSLDHAEIVETLLKCGARTDLPDQEGKAALHWAAFHCHTKIIEKLLEYGAAINIHDQNGNTALLDAINSPYSSTLRAAAVEALLQHDATIVNARTKSGPQNVTALYSAVSRRDTETIKVLLQYGAAIDLPCQDNGKDLTALQLAISSTQVEVAKLLIHAFLVQKMPLSSQESNIDWIHKQIDHPNAGSNNADKEQCKQFTQKHSKLLRETEIVFSSMSKGEDPLEDTPSSKSVMLWELCAPSALSMLKKNGVTLEEAREQLKSFIDVQRTEGDSDLPHIQGLEKLHNRIQKSCAIARATEICQSAFMSVIKRQRPEQQSNVLRLHRAGDKSERSLDMTQKILEYLSVPDIQNFTEAFTPKPNLWKAPPDSRAPREPNTDHESSKTLHP